MKIHSAPLQFGLWLAACLPLPSHASMEIPYWLNPQWMAAKVMEFHHRNTERVEMAQAKAKNNETSSGNANGAPSTASNNGEEPARKINLAPVETAKAKVNEKYLSKEELMELRRQLRQK